MKEKIRLDKEMETLLIPLYGRAQMCESGLFFDQFAVETVRKVDYDFEKLKISKKLQVFMAIRSSAIDHYVNEVISMKRDLNIISLGSGLDARYARVSGYKSWTDLDMPEVANLRKLLLPEIEKHTTIASSVTEQAWSESLGIDGEEEVLVIAEGLFMYLSNEEVLELLSRLTVKFKKLTILFDAYSSLTVKKIKNQPSLRKTGATIKWGIDDPYYIESMNDKLKYSKTIYLTDDSSIRKLNAYYRFMFRTVGKIKVAKEAHRILVYSTKI